LRRPDACPFAIGVLALAHAKSCTNAAQMDTKLKAIAEAVI
jgi:hypothetical protein